MTHLIDSPEPVADRVSEETIRRINFLTGSSIPHLRNATVILCVDGEQYKVHIDNEGRMSLDQPEKT